MAMNNMLTRNLYLDAATGGVLPELHLKEGSNSTVLRILVQNGESTMTVTPKYSALCGIRPDGSEFFSVLYNGSYDRKVEAEVSASYVRLMAAVPGNWRCTLTLLDAASRPSRETYRNCSFLTVLPFTVIVHKKAMEN